MLMLLRDEAHMPWKMIARRFNQRFGKSFALPALQMRYKRLRTRLGLSTPQERRALKWAHRLYKSDKRGIISRQVSAHSTRRATRYIFDRL